MAGVPEPTGNDRIAEERAALQRMATLVAGAAAPEAVFAAVTDEAGRLLGAHHATMSRYDPDGTATVVASWSATSAAFPVGTLILLGGRNAHTLVFQTHRPARISDYADASGPTGKAARGGTGFVSTSNGIQNAINNGSLVATTQQSGVPASVPTYLLGGGSPTIPGFCNENRGLSDGVVFIASCQDTTGIANVVCSTPHHGRQSPDAGRGIVR